MGLNVVETRERKEKVSREATSRRRGLLKTTSTVAFAPKVSLGPRRVKKVVPSTGRILSEERKGPTVLAKTQVTRQTEESGAAHSEPKMTITGFRDSEDERNAMVKQSVAKHNEGGIMTSDFGNQTAARKQDTSVDDRRPRVSDAVLMFNGPKKAVPTLRFCSETLLSNVRELDKSGLPLGFLWTPFGEIVGVPRVARAPLRCKKCAAFAASPNGGSELSIGKEVWACKLCGFEENNAGEISFRAKESPDLYPELTSDVVEYIHSQASRTGETAAGDVSAIVLLIDENLEPEEARWLRIALLSLFACPSLRERRIALLTFSSATSAAVFDEVRAIPVFDVVLPESLHKMSIKQKQKYFLRISGNTSQDQELWARNLEAAVCARSSPFGADDAHRVSEGTPIHEKGSNSPLLQMSRRRGRMVEDRYLDVALRSAIALCKGAPNTAHTRIITIVTGEPTISPLTEIATLESNKFSEQGPTKASTEELEYIEVGNDAGTQQLALDFLAFGCLGSFNASLLMRTARRSHGGIVLSSPHGFASVESLSRAILSLATRPYAPDTLVSVRASPNMSITRVIGPALPTATPNLFVLPGADASAGFTVCIRPRAISSGPAIFQLASKSADRTRVITVAVPLVPDTSMFVTSIDPEASAVLLSRMCIVSKGGVFDEVTCRKSLDFAVQHILSWLNNMSPRYLHHPSAYSPSIPLDLVRLLFEIRRGIMIGPQVHRDNGSTLRSYFLRTEARVGALMMTPRVFYSVTDHAKKKVGIEECAADASYLRSNTVLLIDAGVTVFIWKGRDARNADEIETSIREVVSERDWVQVWVINEGDEMERLLSIYLRNKDDEEGYKPGFFSRFARPSREPLEDVANMSFPRYCASVFPAFNFDLLSVV